MRSPFLTGSRAKTDDRRAATCLMTVFSIVAVSPLAPARADEPVPSSLMERALRNDSPGQPASARAANAAPWIPELRLRATITHGQWPARDRVDTSFIGELAWPLGRSPWADAAAAARDRRQRSVARDALVERIAAAWHARRVADEAADDVEAELAAEEAEATVDALVGDEEQR
jgi:hypothetical protein